MHIGIPALQGAGGLLLLLIALDLLTGKGATNHPEVEDVNVALVPLGTPLLAGPGAIAATIVFVRQADGLGFLPRSGRGDRGRAPRSCWGRCGPPVC